MDKIEQLYNLYLQKGIITSATTLDMFRSANEQQQSSLYDLGKKNNLFSTTDLGTFQGAWGEQQAVEQPQEDLKKKEESVIMGSPLAGSSSVLQKQTVSAPSIDEITGVKRIKDIYAGAEVKQNPEFYDKTMQQITPDLMNKEEEYVVPQMNYQFGPMGFKFEESGATGDWMMVTAPDGKTKKEFSLDPVFGIGKEEEARRLKKFIQDNTNAKGLQLLEKQYTEENKKFSTDEEVDAAFKTLNDQATSLKNDITGLLQQAQQLESEKASLSSFPANRRNDAEYKERLSAYNQKAAALEKTKQDLIRRENQVRSDGAMLEKSVGKYTSMKAEQGGWVGGLQDAFMRGIGKIASGTSSTAIDLMYSKYTGGVDEQELSVQVPATIATGDALQDAKNGGVTLSNAYRINQVYGDSIQMPKAGQSYKDWWNSLSPDQRTAIVDKSNDDLKKEMKANLLPDLRSGAEIVLGDPETTVQWADLKKEGFWGGAILGVSESLPAMIGASNMVGWAQRTANMYAQVTDSVYEEMSKNPEFDNISESEKQMVLAPIGTAVAVLESLGLRNVIANKGLLNRVVLSAMGKAGSTTTSKTFGELVKNEIDGMISKGLLTATGAMLAEAETGAAQQVAEYAVKDIYNLQKEKDMFKTPDFLSAQYIKDIATAGAQEAIGGFVLGVPSAVSAAYSKKGFLSMDDGQFEFFRTAANDSKIEQAYVLKLKQQASAGAVTMKEAKQALNDYRNSVGLYRSIPDELSTQQAKEAMNLLKEKRDLEQQIAGKDEGLVRRQKTRIAEINESLNKISENAVQESSTEGVLPRQQGEATEAGSERGQMGQGVQGQEATQTSAQERVGVLSSSETISVALEQLPTEERVTGTFIQEDGTETPIMGNERMLADLYAIATELSEQERTPQQKSVIDAVEVSLKTLIEEEAQGQQEQIMPDDEISSLNDDQVYVFTAPTMDQVPEQFRESAKVVPAREVKARKRFLGLIPYGGEKTITVSDEVVKYIMTGREAKAAYAQIVAANPQMRPEAATTKATIAQNVAKSVASIFPNLKVTTHKNGEEMRSFAEKNFGTGVSAQVLGDEGGMIVYDANNNPVAIMVNDEVDDPTTLPHEAWHGILIKAFGQDENLFTEFKDGIKKRLIDNGFTDIADQLDVFSESEEYTNSSSQSEEWLVQLGGLLTASGISPDNLSPRAKTLLQQIKDVFNDVAKKIIGSPIFLEDATPDDILDFMVTISDRMRRGETIADFFTQQEQRPAGRGVRGVTQRPGAAGMLNVDPTSIQGYDQMVAILDNLIKKRKERGDSDQAIASKLVDVIATLPAYQNATDIQREAMVRGIRKQFGLKESPSPSVAKTLGTLKDVKKITMSEKELLKKQFRDQARGARDAKKAWMLASKELAKGIKELRGKGKVSIAQAANIISRFSKVNVFDQESIDRFVNYMVNIIQDAQYSEKISRAKSLLPRARKNIKTKIGDAQEVAQDLKKLFAIDPSMIPLQYIDTYMSMLESFGGKTAVLDLKDISTVVSDVSDVLNEIDNEVSIAEEMAERFAYADKVYDDDGNLLYAETVSEMLEQGEITSKEADIMRKYRSIISPVVRAQKTEQEIEQEKARTISAISRMAIDPTNLSLEDEVALAKKIAPLLKPALLNRLPLSKLENIARLIENINNGYMPHFGALVYERLSSFESSMEAVQSVKEAKPIKLSKMYASLKSKLTGRGAILEMIRRSPLYFLDQVFGDFKSKRLFNSLLKGMAEGNDLFRASIDAINKRLDNAHDAVAKSRGYEINETIMSSYRMMTYMLQNEYLSNPGSDQVKPAMDYLKKTIEVLEAEGTKIATRKVEMLQEIVDNYSTGSDIDMKKLFDSFNLAELEAIETITDINNELSEKAVYTAAVIRGKRIDPLVNYVHHIAIPEIKLGEIDSATQMANQYNASISPSSRAMNLQDRKNKVVPLNFDVFASAQRGAKFTLLDYHMTMPIRIARKTVNQMRADIKESGSTAEQKRIVNALDSAVDEVISNVLTNNFITDSFIEKALNFVSKQGYRAVLASAPRFASELTSNMAFATILDRKSFSKGAKYGGFLMSEDAVAFMKNVKSKMTTRLYHGNTLGGRLIDQSILSQTSGVKSAEPVGDIQNVANMIYNISLKKYKNFVEIVADSLISTPDKMVMRPAWFGSFATEFNRQTGKDPDMEKISSGDQEYMSTYADAIEAAKTFADDRSVTVGAADNPFMGILKGTIKPNQNALVKGFNNFNNYMTRFTIYEYIAARQGIYAAMGNGSISRKDGAAMLAAVVTRMTVYSMLTSLLGSAMLSMFADEEEEDEKTIMQKFGQALASTMSSLIVGRDFGNATKSMLSYGVEEINDEVLTGLRNGEYDPYKDAITFSPFPKKKKLDIGDILVSASGSYSTSLKTLDLMARKMLEEPKKEQEAIERSENETNVRIPLELLGNMGMVPLYKDIRKIVMDQMYKDLENAEKKSADKKQAEKEMLRGYENKTDMKRYDPELYDEVFGKGSSTYKEDQAKKKIKKEKEDLKRRMKDDFYDYVPKKSKQSGFGSDEFGSDKFGSDKFGK